MGYAAGKFHSTFLFTAFVECDTLVMPEGASTSSHKPPPMESKTTAE
jgi:hypothetical protein